MDQEVNDLLARELSLYMETNQPIHAKILTSQILQLQNLKCNIDPKLAELASKVGSNLSHRGFTETAYIDKVMENAKKRVPYLLSTCQQKQGLYDMTVKGYCPAGQIPIYGKTANCCMDMKEYMKQSQRNVDAYIQEIAKDNPKLAAALSEDWQPTISNNILYKNVDSMAYDTVMSSKENMIKTVLEDVKFEESRGDEASNAYTILGFKTKEVWLGVKYYALRTSEKIEGLARFIVNNVMSLRTIMVLTLVFRAIRQFLCAFFKGGFAKKVVSALTGLKAIGEFLDKTLGRQWTKIVNYGSQLLTKTFEAWTLCQLLVTVIVNVFFGTTISMLLFAGVGLLLGWAATQAGLQSFWQHIRNLILRYVGTVQILQATFSLATELMQLIGVIYVITTGPENAAAQKSMDLLCKDSLVFEYDEDDSSLLRVAKTPGKAIDRFLRLLKFPIEIMSLFMCWGIDALIAPFVGKNRICEYYSVSNGELTKPGGLKDAFMAQLKTLKWTNPSTWHFDYLPTSFEKMTEHDEAKEFYQDEINKLNKSKGEKPFQWQDKDNPIARDVKKVYHQLANKYHPDKAHVKDDSMFLKVKKHHDILLDTSGQFKIRKREGLVDYISQAEAENAKPLSEILTKFIIDSIEVQHDPAPPT